MSQKTLNPLFAILIFVAHFNCVVEHQLISEFEFGDAVATVDSASLPAHSPSPQESDECDHGCICKGATLASSFVFDVLPFDIASLQFLADRQVICLVPRVQSEVVDSTSALDGHLPLRALDRCAMLQTFVI